MKQILLFLLCFSPMLLAAPTLIFNAMDFDQQSFGLINFEGSQSSVSGVNSYLSTYNASASIGCAITNYAGSYFTPIGSYGIYDGAGSMTIQFNTAVNAVGAFCIGWEGNENPETGGVGAKMRITLANGGGVYTYYYHNYSNLLISDPHRYNGFWGVYDSTYGIAKIEYIWNRDCSGMDNFYFGNNITLLGNGPSNVAFSNISTIPLPNAGVPEPATLVLALIGLLGIWFSRK